MRQLWIYSQNVCVDTHPAATAAQLPEQTGERTSTPESTGKPEEHRELHTEPAATADSTHSHYWDILYNKTNVHLYLHLFANHASKIRLLINLITQN